LKRAILRVAPFGEVEVSLGGTSLAERFFLESPLSLGLYLLDEKEEEEERRCSDFLPRGESTILR
jgi:hypothetical protein